MKTAERAPRESWVVDVEDAQDLEMNMPGYRQRFTFYGEDAAAKAWLCCAKAERAGFKAVAEKVKRHYREEES